MFSPEDARNAVPRSRDSAPAEPADTSEVAAHEIRPGESLWRELELDAPGSDTQRKVSMASMDLPDANPFPPLRSADPAPAPVEQPASEQGPEEHAPEPRTEAEMRDVPLGTLIFRAGLLAEEQLEEALQEGMTSGKRLGEILVERGLIAEADLGRLLAGQKGLPFVELREAAPVADALSLLPEEKARLYGTLPIGFEHGRPVVAVADPTNDLVVENLRRALSQEPRLAVAARGDLMAAIERFYVRGQAPAVADAPAEDRAVEAVVETAPVAEPAPVPGPAQETAEPVEQPPAEETVTAAEPPPFARPLFTAAGEEAPVTAPAVELSVPMPAGELPSAAPEPSEPVAERVEVEPVAERVDVEPLAELPEFEPLADLPEFEPLAELPEFEPLAELPEFELLEVETVPVDPVAVEPAAEQQVDPSMPEAVSTGTVPLESLPVPSPPALEPAPEQVVEPVLHVVEEVDSQQSSNGRETDLDGKDEPTPVEGSAFLVFLRLTDGEKIEIGSFADSRRAREYARDVVRHLGSVGDGAWPFFHGRFLRPDTVVSVDIEERRGDQWLGSAVRTHWASRLDASPADPS